MAVAMLVMVSCSDQEIFSPSDGEVVNVKFAATFDGGSESRADGDVVATDVDELLYAVYKDVTKSALYTGVVSVENGVVESFNLDLVKNQTYHLILWAQKNGSYIEHTDGEGAELNGNITLADGKLVSDNDAFFFSASITATGAEIRPQMIRPFTQINIYASNFGEENIKAVDNIDFTFGNLYSTFDLTNNAVGGAVSDKTCNVKASKEETDVVTRTEDGNDVTYYRIAKCFAFAANEVSGEIEKTAFKFQLKNGDDKVGDEKEFESIPMVRNHRVKIAGLSIETDALPAWDGTTFTEPTTTCGVNGYEVHISTPAELAYVLCNGTDAKTIHICADLDMGGHELKDQSGHAIVTANVPDGATISGIDKNGETKHVIKNLVLNGSNGIFGVSAKDLTINNLEIGGVKLTSNTANTGVLVGSASGTLTMNNVTVSDCTVNGTRTVGGFVGYVDGSASFAACESKNVTTTASSDPSTLTKTDDYKTTGAIVGLFKGYEASETLSFDAQCSVSNYTTGAGAYVAANQSCWVADGSESWSGTPDEKYNNALGNEEYCRGTVSYGAVRIVPHWDGLRRVTPITKNGVVLINSPFDLASLQGGSFTSVTFKSDVDMDGIGDDGIANIPSNFPSYKESTDDKIFTPISSIATLDGQNKTLYNLSVSMVHDAANGRGAGFIQTGSGSTHKDFNIDGAVIINVHDNTIPNPNYGNEDDGGAGNAYAGTLVCSVSSNYQATNVNVKNSAIYAVCKMGGLIGRATESTDLQIKNCTVDNCYLENYNPYVPNYYGLPAMEITLGVTFVVHGMQWWYTCGEVGGLIGFVQCSGATIDGCAVTNTNLNCVGQPDKEVRANVHNKKSWLFKNNNFFDSSNPFNNGVRLAGYAHTKIAGRHVNQFIGEVVSYRASEDASTYTVSIKDYVVDGNSYSQEKNHHIYESGKECEVVGSAYYIGVDLNIASSLQLGHVRYYAGTLKFNPKGGSVVTLEEKSINGDNLTWTGGDFKDFGLGGTSFYPSYP